MRRLAVDAVAGVVLAAVVVRVPAVAAEAEQVVGEAWQFRNIETSDPRLAGTLTLTDDQGQTFVQLIVPGGLETVDTGWVLPATTITVDFTARWNLGVDDLTSR